MFLNDSCPDFLFLSSSSSWCGLLVMQFLISHIISSSKSIGKTGLSFSFPSFLHNFLIVFPQECSTRRFYMAQPQVAGKVINWKNKENLCANKLLRKTLFFLHEKYKIKKLFKIKYLLRLYFYESFIHDALLKIV